MKFLNNTKIIIIIFTTFILTSCNNLYKDSNKYSQQQVERGKALVMEARCGFCHTPYIEEIDSNKTETTKEFSGHPSDYQFPELPKVPIGSQQWLEFMENLENTVWLNEDSIVFSANITPDKETGIGTWTEEMFVNTIKTGKHPKSNKFLNQPMPWAEYSKLTNEEISSIFAYLMTIKPVYNKVPEPLKIK
ncbi:MAG: c-type cytochrome [Candidatus Dadabacteria bacterium]|nr:c-type cytochrome [Candidatus Dadabacteria bacterium]NIQ16630.1 c-type cytochrome [Candidatus Dadabacteria bacterium]